MFRALCGYLVIGSVIVLTPGAPVRAQDTPPERRETPAPGAVPAPVATPAPAQAPAPATTPVPVQGEAAPAPVANPAPAQAPAPVATPAPAPVTPAPVAVPAPDTSPAVRSKEPIGGTSRAKEQGGPDRIRGLIASVEASSIVVKTRDGKSVRLKVSADTTVFSLTKASFGNVDFGTYVGSVSRRLGDEIYSPIRRDSLSWLHMGLELRIIDEDLRGIAVGFTKWDLGSESVMTHGWVDDMEDRVLSIKYGPTDEEETDVEIPRDVPILRMSRGDRSLIKPGARVFAGAQKGPDGIYAAVFVFVGKDGAGPAM